MCICPGCPSYADCGKELAFCYDYIGKSKCINAEKGCICAGCPVQIELAYTRDFYCTRGSEKAQTSKA